MALQFCDAFWGADFTDQSGYEAIAQRLQDGRHMCKDVEELLKMRAMAEEKYGRELVAIARKAEGQTEIGTLKASFDKMKAEIEKSGNLHIQLSEGIREDVQKIEAFREHQRDQTRKLEEIIEKLQKPKMVLHKKTMESKRLYEQRCKEADEAEQASGKKTNVTSSTHRQSEKVLNRARLCRRAANLAEKQYMWNVEQLEKTRQDWESTYRSVCEVFQQQECERINILRCVLWNHCNLLSVQCVRADECYEEVRKVLEQCDIIADNNCFIEMKKTHCRPPAPLEFQCYSDVDSNEGVRRVETKRLSIMLPRVMPSCVYPEADRNSGATFTPAEERGDVAEKYLVLYDFKAKEVDELSISKGEIVMVTEQGEDGWWTAWKDGISGMVPGTYLTKVSPSCTHLASHSHRNSVKWN
ncbi:proline-serine-threonine phosphatase-interacting protein 1b [Triplophysa rosa]|uniref:Proline-serine-threonine phosphatase-interacting protein 1 n=1 Tax=Triplophysa rosa TaxID=992332 RepID=A0A9W7X6A8_TRIRA|nr:proline-serine-threonine phosphatase-interacting protein 1b [Triplophysa rosa]KAI7814443.1 proline-serine-threonine phosphatase-interacting protein 1 [Triplophysa rosa]